MVFVVVVVVVVVIIIIIMKTIFPLRQLAETPIVDFDTNEYAGCEGGSVNVSLSLTGHCNHTVCKYRVTYFMVLGCTVWKTTLKKYVCK